MISLVAPEDWDNKLKQAGGSFLQSRSWAIFQQELGREVFFEQGDGWLYLATKQKAGRVFPYLYLPYGPHLINNSINDVLGSLKKLALKEKAVFVRVEPRGIVDNAEQSLPSLLKKTTDVQPPMTNILSLIPPLEQIRNSFRDGHKEDLKKAEKQPLDLISNLEEKTQNDFMTLMDKTTARQQFTQHPRDYFKKLIAALREENMVNLKVNYLSNQPVCAALFIDFNKTRYYLHAASDFELNRTTKASTLLIWQAIKEAKERGMNNFDFWGVAPIDEPNHRWANISRYKRGFGGTDQCFAGTWDFPISVSKYQLYTLTKKLRLK